MRQFRMRFLLLLALSTLAAAQSYVKIQKSNTIESLRGVSAVSRSIAWASGTHGAYLRTTNGGRTWLAAQVPGASTLDFRGVVAFSESEAFLMSAGPGNQSRIYHTSDTGQHWQLQFTNENPKGFFDSIAFWDSRHGIVLGDPVPDATGKLHFEVLLTDDGKTWREVPASQLPEALEGEGAFAASNSCIAIGSIPDIFFATGGRAARVFHSADRGHSWDVHDTPIVQGADSAGIFSISFRSATDGVIAGGDYKKPNVDGPNLAVTHDGGKSWTLSTFHPEAYFPAAAFTNDHLFVVAQNFVLDVKGPNAPRRWNIKKKDADKIKGLAFNAISVIPGGGGAFVVGAKGLIAVIP